jgi:protein-L-isoaspartate(D-aspartate) O-methyltransferase
MRLVEDPDEVQEGRRCALFANDEPGRGSQALQGLAVDGRQVSFLQASLRVKGDGLRHGQDRSQWPGLVITFFDALRAPAGEVSLGPWLGTFPWREDSARLAVPLAAREAVVRVGLLGGVGSLWLDDVRIAPASTAAGRAD